MLGQEEAAEVGVSGTNTKGLEEFRRLGRCMGWGGIF